MKTSLAVIRGIRWIVGLALAVALPVDWYFRDGLGPDSQTSTGFAAVGRTLSDPGLWILALVFVALILVERVVRGRSVGDVDPDLEEAMRVGRRRPV